MKLVFFLIITLFANTDALSQKVHAILFCSTSDPNQVMSQGSKQDYFKMRGFCKKVAKSLSYKYVEHNAMDEDFSSDSINVIINEVIQQISTNDIVVLYYSGHGFIANKKEQFPILNTLPVGIASLGLHEKLLQKNPKFLLTVIDACSAFKDLDKQDSFLFSGKDYFGPPASGTIYDAKKLNDLFNKCNNVIVTAAQPGFKAVQTSGGSTFTRSLLEAFDQTIATTYSGHCNWEAILEQAYSFTFARTKYYHFDSYPVWVPKECEAAVPKFEIDTSIVRPRFELVIDTKKGRRSFFRGRQWYSSSIEIKNLSDDKIDSVQYYLDVTMPSPIVTEDNVETGFSHNISTYDTFPIKARVYFSDGRVEEEIKDIEFPVSSRNR